jgi:hypothetical protein
MPEHPPIQLPTAPPTSPGTLGSGPGPSWPKVLGIICILFGGLGALAGLWSLLAPFVVFRIFGASQPPELAAHAQKWLWWTVLGSLLSIALAVLLLVGGVFLVSRRPAAIGALRSWAVLKVLCSILTACISYLSAIDQVAAMHAAGSAGPPPRIMEMMMLGGLLLWFLWSLALPVLLLVFFGRPAARRHIATWGPADAV